MRIYVASSWRNRHQPDVVAALREAAHQVYDFRNPAPGNHGFGWSAIDPGWSAWDPERFREALNHPAAAEGFRPDMEALRDSEAVVLVLPCGRSSHIELGYGAGQGKLTAVLILEQCEPELMYRMVDITALDVRELVERLAAHERMESPDPDPRDRADIIEPIVGQEVAYVDGAGWGHAALVMSVERRPTSGYPPISLVFVPRNGHERDAYGRPLAKQEVYVPHRSARTHGHYWMEVR